MHPWHSLDLITAHCALPHVWEPALGEHLDAFKILCLQRTSKFGSSMPCPNCRCYHTIEPLADRSGAIAYCQCEPHTCPEIHLTIDQVTLWEINQPRLARAIARALGCPAKITPLTTRNTFQFASWSADSVPIILTLQTRHHRFGRVIAELLTLGRPYILFAPTNIFLDAACQQLLAHAKAAFFPLDTTVRLTPNGTLEPLRPPAELFAAFTPQPKEVESVAR